MKKILSCSALAIIAAAPAMAGGLTVAPATPVVIAPAPMPTSDWTGGYVGVSAGAGNFSSNTSAATIDEKFNAFGIHGGYTYDMGRFIIGGELDFKKLNIDNPSLSSNVDVTQANLLARLGYDMGKFQPYITAGASQIMLTNGSADLTYDGFAAGLGLDYRMTDHIQMGGRYTHGSYDMPGVGTSNDFSVDTFELRLDYAF